MAEPAAPRPDRTTELPSRRELPPPGASIHLVGIAGAGMRGLAVLLADAGYRVSGCDQGGAAGLAELRERGVELHGEHSPEHVEGVELLVRSSAVRDDSPEIERARAAGVKILRRARALGALVNDGRVIGVAGTHGKTTITAMTGLACLEAGLDPTVVVGGAVSEWRGYARSGGPLAVVEADEYDRSFLELSPSLALVSSLEPEHLDTYGTLDELRAAYEVFARRAIDRNGVVFCADDPGARALGETLESSLSYGLAQDAWCRVEVEGVGPEDTLCRLVWEEGEVVVRLGAPGRHNAVNAAGAFAAALCVGGDPKEIAAGLERFRGVARRLERIGGQGPVTILDDYAHHPTEVRASLDALRSARPDDRLVVVFQPHLYSRTQAFAREFAEALRDADEAWVLPIYPSREAPIEGVDSSLITRVAPDRLRETDAEAAIRRARRALDEGPTVLVFMGAGDVTRLAHETAARLADVTDDEVGG